MREKATKQRLARKKENNVHAWLGDVFGKKEHLPRTMLLPRFALAVSGTLMEKPETENTPESQEESILLQLLVLRMTISE